MWFLVHFWCFHDVNSKTYAIFRQTNTLNKSTKSQCGTDIDFVKSVLSIIDFFLAPNTTSAPSISTSIKTDLCKNKNLKTPNLMNPAKILLWTR